MKMNFNFNFNCRNCTEQRRVSQQNENKIRTEMGMVSHGRDGAISVGEKECSMLVSRQFSSEPPNR